MEMNLLPLTDPRISMHFLKEPWPMLTAPAEVRDLKTETMSETTVLLR